MKLQLINRAKSITRLLALLLFSSTMLPSPVSAALVQLTSSPLATTTTSTVKPNLLLVLDNSGSMDWDHMPDDSTDQGSAVPFTYGYYGLRSSQCNQVYYDPTINYLPPVDATGTSYANASFTAACANGFSGACTVNLNTGFRASQSLNQDPSGQSAYYYSYSGTQTTALLKNYNNPSNTFSLECGSAQDVAPGNAVFSKRRLATTETTTIVISGTGGAAASATGITVNGIQIMNGASATVANISSNSMATNIAAQINARTGLSGFSATAAGSTVTITGPTSAANYLPIITTSSSANMGTIVLTADIFPDTTASKLTNFANWYSFYRTRLMMMKTATGRAFSNLNNNYRVGLSKISASSTPSVLVDTFQDCPAISAATGCPAVSTQRTDWYSTLYNVTTSGSTPLRTALSDAGRYFANKLGVTDPIQYSCQQNFTILSTDGYWNTGDGLKLNGTTMDNQDGGFPRPFNDGGSGTSTVKSHWNSVSNTVTRTTRPSVDTTKTYVATQTSHLNTVQQHSVYSGPLTLNSTANATHGASIANTTVTRPGGGCAPNCLVTISPVPPGLTVGGYVTISGVGTAAYNGTFVVTNISGSQFNYSLAARPAAPGTLGTSNVTTWTNGCPLGQGKYTIQAQHYDSYTNSTSTVTTTTTTTNTIQTDTTTVVTTPYTRTLITTNGVVVSDTTAQGPGAVTTTTNVPPATVTNIPGTPVTTTSTVVTNQANTPAIPVWSNFGAATQSACAASIPASPSAPTTFSTYPASPAGDTVNVGPVTVTPGFPTTGVLGAISPPSTMSGPTITTSSVTTDAPIVTSSGGTSNTLADVAMYYYETDLRNASLSNCTGVLGASVDVCEDNVFISASDNNNQQHMTTFTLGLGASGWMQYSSSYVQDPTDPLLNCASNATDYYSVYKGCSANSAASPPICAWQANGTACNWPIPGMSGSNGFLANVDDLWHAAVNGRGAYYSATNPTTLSSGLANALAGVNTRRGAAAAAATSTLNPVAGNNFAYVASYTTVDWRGNLEARGINVTNGVVSENAAWCVEDVPASFCATTPVPDTSGATTAYYCVTPNSVVCPGGTMRNGSDCYVPVAVACTGKMNSQTFSASDTRKIKTANSSGTALINFDAAYATANPSYFSSPLINGLSQWSTLTPTQQTAAQGTTLLNYLRGQFDHDQRTANLVTVAGVTSDNRFYRYRVDTLGDALESQPAFMANPVFSYSYPGYNTYVLNNASRDGVVFMGANDGMMHGFYAQDSTGAGTPCVIGAITGTHCGGEEAWAYVPSMVIPNMWKLADISYATSHINFVNGSPVTSDICVLNCTDAATAVWKTILVAGLNGGGRGYFALDITIPSSPQLLWEFTTTSGIGVTKDDDLGYSFGKPIITRKTDGTWVVLLTSGYNNVSPGTGKGFLYVLNASSGAIISKISTGAGTTTTPSGLAKIAAFNEELNGNRAGYVYGGDLLGNVWRFDINGTATAAVGTGDVMLFATLFSNTAGTSPQPITTTPTLGKILGKRIIFIGTGKYLENSDLSTTQVQTQYAIKDDNATSTLVNPRNSLVQQTLINGVNSTRSGSNITVNFMTGRGWFADFIDSKERVNIDSKLVQGILVVPTIIPSNTACSPGGYGWLNYFDYLTGSATAAKFDSPIVGVNVLYVNGHAIAEVVTSNDPTPQEPPISPAFKGTPANFSSQRMIWRELIP